MRFHVLTLFPEMISGGLYHSMIKRGMENNLIDIQCINIRDFSTNKHKQVDDYAYGGGCGMLMQATPIYDAYQSIEKRQNTRVVYMTPQGTPFCQEKAKELAKEEELIILCGHYEGIDERVIEEIVTDEISIGDYILTGGELAAMVLIDSVSRLIKDVLGKESSYQEETFANHLLECPQYTRPPMFLNRAVPEVLLSGNHKKIEEWRYQQSLERTKRKRPDLLRSKEAE